MVINVHQSNSGVLINVVTECPKRINALVIFHGVDRRLPGLQDQ